MPRMLSSMEGSGPWGPLLIDLLKQVVDVQRKVKSSLAKGGWWEASPSLQTS